MVVGHCVLFGGAVLLCFGWGEIDFSIARGQGVLD